MSGTGTKRSIFAKSRLEFSTTALLFGLWLSVVCAWLPQLAVAQSDLQPVLISPKYLTNGFFTFDVSGASNRTYLIEGTTNLTDWQGLTTSTLITNPASFKDTNAAHLSRRFYRASLFRTLIITNLYPTWTNAEGLDGHRIAFPSNWVTNQGYDGRIVAYPATWTARQGLDGRMIAFPPGWMNGFGNDARMVAWPTSVFTNATGNDGRLVALPAANWTDAAGADARLVAFPASNWTTNQDGDGRLVAYPAMFFTTTQSTDGRLVAYNSPGWPVAQGADGREIFYSLNNFITTNGADGRVIAYPASGWKAVRGDDGRLAAYPTNSTPTLDLNFQNQAYLNLLDTLTNALSSSDLNDYIIYSYFVAEDQGQSD